MQIKAVANQLSECKGLYTDQHELHILDIY